MTTKLYLGTDSLLKLEGLKDSDDTVVTAATVTATVYEADGSTEVSGQSWPLTLSHTSGGTYEGVLEDSLSITKHARYVVELVAEIGSTKRTWRETVVALYADFG